MTIAQLRAFLAAARTGSFTAAARELGVSQPTVSELVSRLEEESQLALFVRAGRRLELTVAGQELLPWAQRTVEGMDGARQCLDDVRGVAGGVASVGVLRNAPFYFLSDLAAQFLESRPGVRLRLVGLNSVDVAESVRLGRTEAGLVVLPIDDAGLDVVPVARDEVVWISSRAGSEEGPVSLQEALEEPLILYDAYHGNADPTRRQLTERAQAHGLSVVPLVEVEWLQTALSLVARGVGGTIAARAVTFSEQFPSGLIARSFDDPMYDTLALVTRKGTSLSPATDELVALALRAIASNSRLTLYRR